MMIQRKHWMWKWVISYNQTIPPDAYEIVFAYDNITPGFFDVASGTIGVENVDGTVGTLVSYNDTELSIADGSAICFDWALVPAPPTVITFQVTVDAEEEAVITNSASHSANGLGMVEEFASATTIANDLKPVADDQNLETDEDVALDITLTATGLLPGPAMWSIEIDPEHGTSKRRSTKPRLHSRSRVLWYG